MRGHTPGPWKVDRGTNPGFLIISGASFNITVVTSATDLGLDDYIKRTADARLIAAAPEMLEALEYIEGLTRCANCDACAEASITAREAIAKAAGETR